MVEYTKTNFNNAEILEISKDLFPYDYYSTEENLTDLLVRLIFKAFNYGKMIGERGDIDKIKIDYRENFVRIIFDLMIDGKIRRI